MPPLKLPSESSFQIMQIPPVSKKFLKNQLDLLQARSVGLPFLAISFISLAAVVIAAPLVSAIRRVDCNFNVEVKTTLKFAMSDPKK